MKNLTIDIGNTSIKYAIFDDKEMMHNGRIIGHDMSVLTREIAGWDVDNTMICSTIKLSDGQTEILKQTFSNMQILTYTTLTPIHNKYKSPQTLGMDRLAAVIGAYAQSHDNTLIIDMGTAITYDFINKEGEYMGGNISPGMDMRLKALHEHTDRLPLVEPEGKHPWIGEDTESAIRCGVTDGIRYEIEGYIRKLSLKYHNLCVFFTGGDYLYFEDEIKMRIFADKYLVLKGLNETILFNSETKETT